MDRRSFLKNVAVGAAAAAGIRVLDRSIFAAETSAAAAPVTLRLCSQDGRVPGKSLKEKVEKLQKWGASAVELGGNPDVKAVQEALKDSTLKVAALCWGSHGGDLISPDAEKRKKGIADIKIALEKGGELGSTGVIFVPAFNGQSKYTPAEIDKVLLDILPELGDFGQKVKCPVILEPLTRKETFYLRRVGQGAEICAKVNNPGIAVMGDFYHMSKEEQNDQQAFEAGGKWLRHVHLATGKSRIMPGQEPHQREKFASADPADRKGTFEPHSYVEGFKGLKKIAYPCYCSLECGCMKGTNPEEEIPKAFEFLRKQWEEATV